MWCASVRAIHYWSNHMQGEPHQCTKPQVSKWRLGSLRAPLVSGKRSVRRRARRMRGTRACSLPGRGGRRGGAANMTPYVDTRRYCISRRPRIWKAVVSVSVLPEMHPNKSPFLPCPQVLAGIESHRSYKRVSIYRSKTPKSIILSTSISVRIRAASQRLSYRQCRCIINQT